MDETGRRVADIAENVRRDALPRCHAQPIDRKHAIWRYCTSACIDAHAGKCTCTCMHACMHARKKCLYEGMHAYTPAGTCVEHARAVQADRIVSRLGTLAADAAAGIDSVRADVRTLQSTTESNRAAVLGMVEGIRVEMEHVCTFVECCAINTPEHTVLKGLRRDFVMRAALSCAEPARDHAYRLVC
jgi:hypothetical protein